MPAISQRNVVIHIHLFKNAGTSVERGLSEFFGDSWVSHDRAGQGGVFGDQYLRDWLRGQPNIEALSSHQVRPPLLEDDEYRFVPIVFLRHPLDRIRSAFDFETRQGPVTPSSEVASGNDMGAWIDFHRERGSAQCRDFHVAALSQLRWDENGGLRHKLPKSDHLASAREFLNTLPAVGLVEEYESSWRLLSASIRSVFPKFEGPVVQANKTESRDEQLSDRLAAMRRLLGAEAYAELEADNEADLELYRWALERMADGS